MAPSTAAPSQRREAVRRHRPRRFVRLAASLLGLVMAATTVVAHANPGDGSMDIKHPTTTIASSTAATPAQGDLRPAAAETPTAVALVNRYRGQVGLRGLVYDTNLDAALRAHANYIQLNHQTADFDPYTELTNLPGYTTAGAGIAPYISLTAKSSSYSDAVELLMMDPWERTARLLDPNAAGVAITRTTDFTVFAFSWSATTTSPALSFPRGPGYTQPAFASTVAPYYTGNCPQQSAAWGYPISVQFDHRSYDSITAVSSSLTRDGVPVTYCLLWQPSQTGMRSIAVLIPTSPLVQGSHYSGFVTATGVRDDGTRGPATTIPIDFTTVAPVTATPGDQTGDNVADLIGVDNTGALRLYKGVLPGRLGHGWVIGSGWGSFTWIAHTKDITGDGREDLLGRRSDGALFLFAGRSMGSYDSARQVGKNWNGLRGLTVVGDMVGNGSVHVVGIAADGSLMRYTLTAQGMADTRKIGAGWSGMDKLTSVGDFNGDATSDIIALGKNGILYAYFTQGGGIARSQQVGQGWGGWTALFSPGDLTGDRRPDLMGRNAAGELYYFQNKVGGWGTGTKSGQGWGGFTLFG